MGVAPDVDVRHRNLIDVPLGGGDKCPSLIDTKRQADYDPPTIHCDDYQWLLGDWSQCRLLPDEVCGRGVQHRTVLCVQATNGVPVTDYKCLDAAPRHTQSCDVMCPLDCELGSWGPWSDCLPNRCRRERDKSRGHRMRTRSIIQQPAHGGSQCAHTTETQACEYELCYSWRVQQNASYCELQRGACGNGTKHLAYVCYNFDGMPVSHEYCHQPRPVRSEPCYVPCANDCVLSDWSEWSSCSQSCDSHLTSGYRTRKRRQLAPSHTGGRQCPVDKWQYTQYEKCSDHSMECVAYYWQPSPWSECHVTDEAAGCGSGVHERSVHCFRTPHVLVLPRKCVASLKPSWTRNCTVSCKRECVVSEFTDWSPCSSTCSSPDVQAVQSRRRFILHQSDVGSRCPGLVESVPCVGLPACVSYSWRVGRWSTCILLHRCGSGYRIRDVHCLSHSGEVLDKEICILELGEMPDVTDTCVVSCEPRGADCRLSNWSEWSPCTQACGGHSTRHRFLEGNSRATSRCNSSIQHRLTDRQSCRSCNQFYAQTIGFWSSCILNGDVSALADSHRSSQESIGLHRASSDVCGVGTRYHAQICTDGKGTNRTAESCGYPEFLEEMCFEPCPVDCEVSPWSEWSSCTTDGGCGLGTRQRYRYVLRDAVDGGRACPPMKGKEEYMSDLCSVPCELYEWRVDIWSACGRHESTSQTSSSCGVGLQTRSVRCHQRLWLTSASKYVYNVTSDDKCAHLPQPVGHVSDCRRPCADECVLTSWSEWSECSQGCNGTRMRSREVVREPSRAHANCPAVTDSSECVLNQNCYIYTIRWSDMSTCLMRHSRQLCGSGRKYSVAHCVRSDGVLEHLSYCGLTESRATREEECQVSCPVDCIVSQWTAWTACNATCGLGIRTRMRHVIMTPRFGGRLCPTAMTQSRSCSHVDCFKWHVTEWGDCQIEDISCGYGERYRDVICVRHDGVQVDTDQCPDGANTFYKLREPCHVPCAGDCRVTEWSSWGLCHHACAPGITRGVQTRSRSVISRASALATHPVPCPRNLQQTRTCHSEDCVTYQWQTSAWYGRHRSVWCQRSDGVHVTGGCASSLKPSEYNWCISGCPIPNSYCTGQNQCACASGYGGTRSLKGELVSCSAIKAHLADTNITVHFNNTRTIRQDVNETSSFWLYFTVIASCIITAMMSCAIFVLLRLSQRDKRLREAREFYGIKTSVHYKNGTKSSTCAEPDSCDTAVDTPLATAEKTKLPADAEKAKLAMEVSACTFSYKIH